MVTRLFLAKADRMTLRDHRGWATDVLTARGADDPFLEPAVGFIEWEPFFAQAGLAPDPQATGYLFGAVLYDQRHGAEAIRPAADFGQVEPALLGVPLLHLRVADIAHGPPHLANATSACWAALRSDGNARHALTAKHAVAGKRVGQTVAFQGHANFGKLTGFCDSSVDAAIVEAPVRPVGTLSPLAVEDEPAIGDDVEFTGAQSGTCSGKVTRTHIFPQDPAPYDPQRVYVDMQGVAGDSGALLRLQGSGAAVGIYTGIKNSGSGTSFGQSQYMSQATALLDIDLYEEQP